MSQTCPSCAQPASGRFCAHCGASLEAPAACPDCGNRELPAGARFCNQCGSPVGTPALAPLGGSDPATRPGGSLPWAITGVALVALLGVILWPRLRGGEAAPVAAASPAVEAPFAAGAGGATGDARSVDLSSMSPREAADRLFNRVMQNVSSGDSAQAKQFLPMALMAYERVPDLDLDGHYHLAVLHLVNSDPGAARAEAETILQKEPNHLFGLFTAAQAEQAQGDTAAARELYGRFLENYDSEVARKLPEYVDHQQVLPSMQEEARKAAGK